MKERHSDKHTCLLIKYLNVQDSKWELRFKQKWKAECLPRSSKVCVFLSNWVLKWSSDYFDGWLWSAVVHIPSLNCWLWDGFGGNAAARDQIWVSAFICSFLKCGAQATMQLNTQMAKLSFWMYITLGLTCILKTSTKHPHNINV